MRTLKDAKIGQSVVVLKLHGEGAVRRRIMDMGITKNVEVFIRKVALLGAPSKASTLWALPVLSRGTSVPDAIQSIPKAHPFRK